MSAPEIGRLGRYTLLHRLGQGSMAAVHAARDERDGRLVAIKIILQNAFFEDHTDELIQRLRREEQIGRTIDHPGVIKVFDLQIDGDTLYLVMELVEGRPLDVNELSTLGPVRRPLTDPLATTASDRAAGTTGRIGLPLYGRSPAAGAPPGTARALVPA